MSSGPHTTLYVRTLNTKLMFILVTLQTYIFQFESFVHLKKFLSSHTGAAGAKSLKSKFENMALMNKEESEKQAKEERERRVARERREREEEAQRKEEVCG